MTDKEIIIDGVNVSKCEYRDWRNLCHCDNTQENAVEKSTTGRYGCDYNPNCHFKQLKRAGQKLEKIKANCNETLSECSCKNPIIDVDCRECTRGGRVEKAKEILQIIEGEENE